MAAPFADIDLDDQVVDCCFHPSELLLSVGLIDGSLETYALSHLHRCDDGPFVTAESGWSSEPHDDSCRSVAFVHGGEALLSASKDGSLVVSDVRTGQESFRTDDAHDGAEISRIFSGSTCTATGDEDGIVKLWDLRSQKETAQFCEHHDFISDIAFHQRDTCLLSTSGDGTIAVFDLKMAKLRARSESDADDEYLSCQIIKHGRKIAVGTQDGVINLFSWGYFNDCSDRYPGHPNSIESMVCYDDDTLLTGAGDGAIRIISVLPNKLLGVLGVHEEDDPIERLTMSHDKLLLASSSHDESIKIWSLKCLQEDTAADELDLSKKDETSPDDDDNRCRKRRRRGALQKTKMKAADKKPSGHGDFFGDIL